MCLIPVIHDMSLICVSLTGLMLTGSEVDSFPKLIEMLQAMQSMHMATSQLPRGLQCQGLNTLSIVCFVVLSSLVGAVAVYYVCTYACWCNAATCGPLY